MSARLVPALGLAAACTMLTGVGVLAIGLGQDSAPSTTLAGAVRGPAPTTKPAPSLAAETHRTTRATRTRSTAATVQPSVTASTGPAVSAPPVAAAPTSAPVTQTPVATSSGTPNPVGGRLSAMPNPQSAIGADGDQYGQAVFRAINQTRAAHGLPALTWSGGLALSASRHNHAMAATNTLSHQVGGEPSLGSRETQAGVSWTYAAENIGWTTDHSVGGALAIENEMAAETPPNDAHRRNILSRSATSVGIDVLFDAAHGRLWLTEDFSG